MDKTVKEKILKKTSILQFIPINAYKIFDSEKYNDKYIHYKNNKLKIDYLITIVHKFMVKKYLYKMHSVRLSSTLMKDTYGKKYARYIEYLQNHNIIYLKSRYYNGIKCNEYALHELFMNCEIYRYENSDPIILRKWVNLFMCYEINDNMENKIHSQFIMKRLIKSLFKVDINGEKARQFITSQYMNKKINHESFLANMMNVDAIDHKSLYYSEDSYGRFHTNFTTLKKNIRTEFLTIDNQELMELDIKNSQPVFLLSILKDYNFHLLHPKEYEKYYNSVRDGLFYDELSKYYKVDRKKTKKLVYTVLFGKNSLKMFYNRIFKKVYPEVFNFIVDYKKKFKSYNELAHELQRKESCLVYDNICYFILKNNPNLDLFTVHDSLIFPKKYEKEVSKIFFDHVNALFN